nr:MAG TPA: hypothetical protein [Bacteriophage sp.]
MFRISSAESSTSIKLFYNSFCIHELSKFY